MILTTRRLELRPWNESDAEVLFKYAKEPDVGPRAGWKPHESVSESLDVISNILSRAETYAICFKGENEPIGSVSLHLKGHTDLTDRDDECELGYWLGKPFWGRGIMTEAANEMLRHAFEDLGMNKVWAGYYDGNDRSKRVQEKCGFIYQWTTQDVDVPALGEKRVGHVSAITREAWLRQERSAVAINDIEQRLFAMRDEKYASGQIKIIPSVDPERIIGVRTPELREFAKELYAEKEGKEDIDAFLNSLPHRYFDEDQLHAFIISLEKDFDSCIAKVEKLLPYIDNWATCDQLSPKAFKKYPEKLLPYIEKWLASGKTYTVRFAIGMLMQHFLDGRFSPDYLEKVSHIRSDEYYINMMIAWYFATALAKQYDAIIPYIENCALDPWTHNKTIQKSIESFRITPEQKDHLRSLKVKTDKSADDMKGAVLYVHGRGGGAKEAKRYVSLFPGYDVCGIDYSSYDPWDAGKEIYGEIRRLKQKHRVIIVIANSLGAFFTLCADADKLIDRAYFISPLIDMERLIMDLMKGNGITEEELKKRGTVMTESGEELSWKYLSYVRDHRVRWNVPTQILYGQYDGLVPYETVSAFAEKYGAEITVMEYGEHWFHTKDQLAFLDKWIISKENERTINELS